VLQSATQFWAHFDSHARFLAEFGAEEDHTHASFTITLDNGLVVKFLPNGDVAQQLLRPPQRRAEREFEDIVNPSSAQQAPHAEAEYRRIVSGKGSLIRYMKDGAIYVYYANGNISYTKGRSAPWITTNNKGLRKQRTKATGDSPLQETELEAIPCARRTDPQLGAKIVIRADQTLVITYKDGSVYVRFRDGTEMLTSRDKDCTIVEHPDYATVKVIYDQVKMRTDTIIGLGSAYASVGFENLFERSNDGRIVHTLLPDGTKVMGYREKRELPGYN
jgi:DNA-binding cell septation regulator SpoVG